MNLDVNFPPIQRKEFELDSGMSDLMGHSLHNLMPRSSRTFSYAENRKFAELLENASHKTLQGLVAVYGILYGGDTINAQDWNNGNFQLKMPVETPLMSSYGPWVVLSGIVTIGATWAMSSQYKAALDGQGPDTIPVIEKDNLFTNNAKLREDVYNAALRSGIMPNKFKDPISLETIKTPVAFSYDPSATIYDLETVNDLRQRGVTQNPLVRNLPLNFSKLVYLPEVKKQIDEIVKAGGGEEEIANEEQDY